jgi:hypothetical protein
MKELKLKLTTSCTLEAPPSMRADAGDAWYVNVFVPAVGTPAWRGWGGWTFA